MLPGNSTSQCQHTLSPIKQDQYSRESSVLTLTLTESNAFTLF